MQDTLTIQEILLKARIRCTTGSEAEWTAANPVLQKGEVGFVAGTMPAKFKVGDGTTPWSALGWAQPTAVTASADGLMSAADKQKLDDLTGGSVVFQCTIPGME